MSLYASSLLSCFLCLKVFRLFGFQLVLKAIALSRMLPLAAGQDQAVATLCAANLCAQLSLHAMRSMLPVNSTCSRARDARRAPAYVAELAKHTGASNASSVYDSKLCMHA